MESFVSDLRVSCLLPVPMKMQYFNVYLESRVKSQTLHGSWKLFPSTSLFPVEEADSLYAERLIQGHTESGGFWIWTFSFRYCMHNHYAVLLPGKFQKCIKLASWIVVTDLFSLLNCKIVNVWSMKNILNVCVFSKKSSSSLNPSPATHYDLPGPYIFARNPS